MPERGSSPRSCGYSSGLLGWQCPLSSQYDLRQAKSLHSPRASGMMRVCGFKAVVLAQCLVPRPRPTDYMGQQWRARHWEDLFGKVTIEQ